VALRETELLVQLFQVDLVGELVDIMAHLLMVEQAELTVEQAEQQERGQGVTLEPPHREVLVIQGECPPSLERELFLVLPMELVEQ
jgi:hypothetical protein